MATLYIIGNGFDLAHKLESSYQNFYDWLRDASYINKNDNIYNDFIRGLTNLNDADIYSDDWCDFEEALGNLSVSNILDEIYYLATEDKKEDEFKNLTIEECLDNQMLVYFYWRQLDEIKEIFAKWARSIEAFKPHPEFSINDEEGDLYLTFNYTKVLEDVYDIDPKQILHIHGCVSDPSSIIVGHNKKYSLSDFKNIETYKINLQRYAQQIIDILNKPFKDTSRILEQHQKWFDKLKDKGIDTIELYGLSFGEIDDVYFQEIKRQLPQAKWRFALHGFGNQAINIAKQKVEEFIDRIGLNHALCSAFWQDSIMSKEEMLFINNN